MLLALQLHLVMVSKYSTFGVDTFNPFRIMGYILAVFAHHRRQQRRRRQRRSSDRSSSTFSSKQTSLKDRSTDIDYFFENIHDIKCYSGMSLLPNDDIYVIYVIDRLNVFQYPTFLSVQKTLSYLRSRN